MDKEFEQFRATQGVRSSSDTQRSRDKNIQSQRKAIEKAAYELQIDPIDLATVIDYETGGTFDPWQKGPTTKWGQHRGLIQFGEPQRREFGVYQGQTFDEQITTSVVKYLRQRGVKPGMTFDQVYATVNGGSPNRNRNTPDVGTGRTIQDNINKALSQSRPRVLQRFGWGESVNTEFEAWRQKNTVDTEFEAWRRQRQGSPNVQVQQEQPVNPAFTEQDIANFEERFGVKTTPPTPEPPATLNAQRMAASDPASTRIATLFTQGEAIPDRTPDEVDVPIANGQILRANQQKLAAFMQSTGVTLADMQKPGFDFTPLIGGKAENLGVDGGANAPMAVVTRDANTGAEMVASGITDPNAITYEAGLQRAQFPNQDTVTGLESAQDVAKEREQMTAQNVPPLMGQERLEASFQRTPPEPEYIRRSAAELEAPGVKFFEFEKTGKVGDDLEYLGINEGIHYAEDKLGDKWKLKITGDNGKWERVDPFPAQLTFNNAVYERVGDGKYRSADGQVFDVREEKDKDGNSVFVRVQPPSPSQRVEKRQKVVAQRTQGLAPGEADDVAAANESIARQDAEEQAALARQGVPTQSFRDERGAGISIAIPQGLDQRQANDYVRAELQSRYNVDLPKDWGFLGGYSGSGNVVISADDLRKLGVNVQREESARQRPFQEEIPQGLRIPELPESQAEKEIESRIQSPAYSFQEIMKSGMASLDPRVVGIALANRLWGDEGQTLDRDYVEAEKKRLKDKYGTYGAAWNAEKYFQNMDALETTVRVASQAGRSFLRNLVSGTGKTAAFFDNLAETFGPASILPENLRPSLRNTANALDMAVRILTGAKTLEEARKGYTGASEFDKTTIVKALDEFEKAVGDDPVLKERVLGDLGEGLGSLGAFVALGALMPSMAVGRFTAGKAALKRGMPRLVSGAAVKAGQLPLETAVSGALQTSGKMAQEGKRAGLTENEARLYGGFGVLLGAVEMFGAGRALIHGIKSPIVRGNVVRGVLDAIKAKGRNVIENTGREAGQEFFQEFSQSVGGKSALEFLKDRDARAYDRLVNAVKRLPEQMREAAVNDALIGLLVGGVAGGAGGAIQRVPRETAYKVTETAEVATPVIIDGKGEGVVVEDRGKTVVVDHAPKVNKDGETTYGKRSIERKDRVTPLVEVESPTVSPWDTEEKRREMEWQRELARAEDDPDYYPNEALNPANHNRQIMTKEWKKAFDDYDKYPPLSEQPARVEAEGDVSAGVGKEQDVEFRPTRLGEGVTAPESKVARGEAGLRPTMEARQDTLEVVPKEGESKAATPIVKREPTKHDKINVAIQIKERESRKYHPLELYINGNTVEVYHSITSQPVGSIDLETGQIIANKSSSQEKLQMIANDLQNAAEQFVLQQELDTLRNYPIRNQNQIRAIETELKRTISRVHSRSMATAKEQAEQARGEGKTPREQAKESVASYAESLTAMSDAEVKAEAKRTGQELNAWSNATPNFVRNEQGGVSLNPALVSAEGREKSERFLAASNEEEFRQSGGNLTQQQYFDRWVNKTIDKSQRAEFLTSDAAKNVREQTNRSHRRLIEDTLKKGRTVSPEILADYPDLAKEFGGKDAPKREAKGEKAAASRNVTTQAASGNNPSQPKNLSLPQTKEQSRFYGVASLAGRLAELQGEARKNAMPLYRAFAESEGRDLQEMLAITDEREQSVIQKRYAKWFNKLSPKQKESILSAPSPTKVVTKPAQPAASVEETEQKKPWEMTAGEFNQIYDKLKRSNNIESLVDDSYKEGKIYIYTKDWATQTYHPGMISKALRSGDLTAERARELGHFDAYPDLAKEFGGKDAPTFEQAKDGEIYQTNIKDLPYAVRESADGYGDRLFASIADAQAYLDRSAEMAKANQEFQDKQDALQLKEQQKSAAKKAEASSLSGFTEGMTPMQRGRVEKALQKKWRHDGKAQTTKQIIDGFAAEGDLRLTTEEVNKIADMSRMQYFRATNQQQEAHERRQREAGKKTVYFVNGLGLGKIAYDYAQYLQQKATATKPAEEVPVKEWVNRRIERTATANFVTETDEQRRKRLTSKFSAQHKQAVRNAIISGRTIPPSVLIDYPDLQRDLEEINASSATTKPAEASERAEKGDQAIRKGDTVIHRGKEYTVMFPPNAKGYTMLRDPSTKTGGRLVKSTSVRLINHATPKPEASERAEKEAVKPKRKQDPLAGEPVKLTRGKSKDPFRNKENAKAFVLATVDRRASDVMDALSVEFGLKAKEITEVMNAIAELPQATKIRLYRDLLLDDPIFVEEVLGGNATDIASEYDVSDRTATAYTRLGNVADNSHLDRAADLAAKRIRRDEAFPRRKAGRRQQFLSDDSGILRQSATPASALDEVYNDDGTVNYDKAKNVAERIRSGELEVVRLDRRGEQGRLVGGQRNVEASVILAANEAASPQAESQRNEGQRLANADILRQAASVEDMFDPATIEAELAKIEPVREKTSVSDITKWIEENAESAGYRVIEVSGLSENSFGKSQYIRLEGKDDNGKPFTEEIRVSDHGMGAKRKFYTAVYSLEQAERALFPDRYKKVGYKTNDTDKLMLSENEVRPDDEVIRRFTSKKGNPSVEVRRPRSSTRWERISGNYPDLPQGHLLAPNGKPSNLPNERIWKMVRTPAFKAWFGDWINDPASASQVVDENGEPAIVYHGTTSPLDFKAFRAVPNDIGIHFGTIGQANDRLNFLDVRDPRVNQRILPVFLSIGNPLRLRDVGWFDWANVPDALKDTGLFTDSDISQLRRFDDYAADIASDYNEANDIDPDSDNFDYEQSDEYIELQESFREAVHDFLESYGYDGVVYKNTGETAGGIEFARKLEDAKKSVFAKYNFTGGAVPEAMAKSPEYQDYNNLRKEYEAFREQNAEDSYIAFTPNQIKSIFNRGTFSPDDASILRQSASVAQPFYSRVESIIADKMPNKATPAQVAALLAKNGVKELDPEFQAMKLWLEGKDSVSKAEVVEFAEANRTVVGEVVKGSNLVNKDIDILREAGIEIERNESDPNSPLGFFFNGDFIDSAEARDAVKTGEITQEVADAIKRLEEADDDRTTTKFDQWQLPGESENYREEFLTAPPQSVEKAAQAVKDFEKQFNSKPIPEDRKAEWERLRQAVADAKGWKDGHDAYDDITNPIARARYNDRTTSDGDTMLFAEEIQQPSKDNLAKMPKVYSKFGEEMMLRKLLYRAALGGYDYFGLTTGEQQADRYSLAKQVNRIQKFYKSSTESTANIIFPHGALDLVVDNESGKILSQRGYQDAGNMEGKNLDEVIGKELAKQFLDAPQNAKFEGEDLKIGGEGLKRRYDRKHVDYINKLMKPYGVQVESKEIATNNGETETVHAVRISPEFKAAVEASIRDNGGAFPLFKARDAESAAYLTKTLPKVATPDLMREVSSAIQPDAMLEVNEEGSEFLRRVFNTIGQGSGEFFGALLPKSILQKASDRIKVYARDMEKAGWTKDDLKPIRDLAKNLGTLAKNPDAIVYVYDDALPEETHHRLVTQAGGISADAIARLKESPLWKSERFDKEYPNASDTVRAIELAAKIETGQDYWKGKATNAQKVAFLRTVADSIIDANTVDGVLTLDPQYFERVLRYGTDTQSNIGRTAANEQDAARGERIDEGGREAGEAERDQGRETGRESDVGVGRDTEGGVREDAEDAGLEAARPKAPSLKEKRPGKTGLDVDAERLTEAQKKKQKVAAISRVLGIEVYYDPQSREETERKAAELTANVGVSAAIEKALAPNASAEGMFIVYKELDRLAALYDFYTREGRGAEAAVIGDAYASLLTRTAERQIQTGREVEVAKVLTSASPSLALLAAERRIKTQLGDDATLSDDQRQTILVLQTEISDLTGKYEDAARRLRNAQATINRIKSEKALEPQTVTAAKGTQQKLLKEYKERESEILQKLHDLFPNAPAFTAEPEILRMAAVSDDVLSRYDGTLTPEQAQVAIDFTVGQVLQGSDYGQVMGALQQLGVSETDAKWLHFDAIQLIRPSKDDITSANKEKRQAAVKTRREHYKQADAFGSPEKAIARAIKNVKASIERLTAQIESGEVTTAKPAKSEQASSPELEALRKKQKELQKEVAQKRKELKRLQRAEAVQEWKLSGIAQDALKNDAYKDNDALIKAIDYLTNVRVGKEGRSLNGLINLIRATDPSLSMRDAELLASDAKKAVKALRDERQRIKDEANNISNEARAEMNRLRVERTKAARRMSAHLMSIGRQNEWAMKRINNLLRGLFVNNYGTQLFNAVQSAGVSMPAKMILDLFDAGLQTITVNAGENAEIRAKDVLLPWAYIAANNKQLASEALAYFPEEYYRVHAGILGDIEIDKLPQGQTAPASTAWLHTAIDTADVGLSKLSRISGAKWQEMHFRNAMVAARFDQTVRAKTKGKKSLLDAMQDGTLKDYITEKDAMRAADDALEVTFASEINDPIGRKLKEAYDYLDNFVPLILNPVTYARFTYTTTKVMVMNPLLFGMLDAQWAGGRGYNNQSIAKAVLGWMGVAVAWGLMSALGGDDDRWDTLFVLGEDQPPVSVKRFFPLSSYFYIAHLIDNAARGGTMPSRKEILEGLASLETDYFMYGPGIDLFTTVKEWGYDGTREIGDVGRATSRLLGNYAAAATRFVSPFRTVWAQIDKEESALRKQSDSASSAFLSELARSVPGVTRAVGEKQLDVVAEEPIYQPFPLGRLVGLNLVHPSFLKAKDSPATQQANNQFSKTFPSEGRMTAEERELYSIRRQLREGVRRGIITSDAADARAIKYLADRVSGQSLSRLRSDLRRSELQSTLHWNFAMVKNPKTDLDIKKNETALRKLRKVWAVATRQEKDEMLQVLQKKQLPNNVLQELR